MLHRIRTAFVTPRGEKMREGGQAVEVDETYVGGKLKNMTHKRRKPHKKDPNTNKTAVMGYLERW